MTFVRARFFLLLAGLSLVGWGYGCASRDLVRHDWDRRDGVAQLLRLSDVGLEHMDDLTAEARITFTNSETRRSATASIMYARSDLFRIDVRGPLFSHILTAVVWGDSLTVLSGGQAWSGILSDRMLTELTDFDVGPYDIRYALLASCDRAAFARTARWCIRGRIAPWRS